ncbi:MAG: hypothetical protein EAZ50_09525, partial [Runella slithyformis]
NNSLFFVVFEPFVGSNQQRQSCFFNATRWVGLLLGENFKRVFLRGTWAWRPLGCCWPIVPTNRSKRQLGGKMAKRLPKKYRLHRYFTNKTK